jgi:serine/threonine-protein kinase
MFFQTDIYSFGIVLFELLAGRVPFPLLDNGETARNKVMLAHMEAPVPDLKILRRQYMPRTWAPDVQARESIIPQWLIDTVHTCLEKKPVHRFANGRDLFKFVHTGFTKHAPPVLTVVEKKGFGFRRKPEPKIEVAAPVPVYQPVARSSDDLARIARENEEVLSSYPKVRRGISRSAMIVLIMLLALAGIAGYALLSKGKKAEQTAAIESAEKADTTARAEVKPISNKETKSEERRRKDSIRRELKRNRDSVNAVEKLRQLREDSIKKAEEEEVEAPNEPAPKEVVTEPQVAKTEDESKPTRYKVIGRAHFHNEPDESTRRGAFITHWNNRILTPQREEKGFVYIVFRNDEGQTSRGWLNKKDLKPVE